MRRLTPLLLAAGFLWPSAALAASPPPLSTGELSAVHVLHSARVFTDPTAEAGPAVTPAKLRAIISTSPIKMAIMPAAAKPAGQSANDVAKAVLGASGHPEAVLFVLIGREYGAYAGSRSGISPTQAQTIAHTAFAAHQAGGFTRANVEAVLEDSATAARGALIAAPSVAPSQEATVPGADTTESTHKDPPAWLVVGAVVVIVIVVLTVAIMSRLSRRHPLEEPTAVDAEPVVEPSAPETEPSAPAAETEGDPEPTGALPVVAEVPAGPPPPPQWPWTGGEWEQAEPLEV